MFYDNMLSFYKNKIGLGKILKNNYFIIKNTFIVSPVYFLFSVARTLFYSFNALINAYILKCIIDEIVNKNDYNNIIKYVLMLLLLFTFDRIFSYFNSKYSEIISLKLSLHMNNIIYKKIAKCELKDYDDPEWYNQLSNALTVNREGFSTINLVVNFISSIINIIAIAYILFAYKWYICLYIILISIIGSIINNRNNKNRYDYQVNSVNERRKASYYPSILFDVNYVKERKMFNYADWILELYNSANDVIIKKLSVLCKKFANNFLLMGLLSNGLVILTTLT